MGVARLRCATPPVSEVGQVGGRVGGGGRGGHTPVDTDRAFRLGGGLDLPADHEPGVSVPDAVRVDADTGRGRGQFTGPHERDARASRQTRPTDADGQARQGLFQRPQGVLGSLEPRPAPALDLRGVVRQPRVGPQRLLLGDPLTAAQPRVATAGLRRHLGQPARCWPAPDPVLVDRLVPRESPAGRRHLAARCRRGGCSSRRRSLFPILSRPAHQDMA